MNGGVWRGSCCVDRSQAEWELSLFNSRNKRNLCVSTRHYDFNLLIYPREIKPVVSVYSNPKIKCQRCTKTIRMGYYRQRDNI